MDLARVPPSGAAGLVTADDVRAFAAGRQGRRKPRRPRRARPAAAGRAALPHRAAELPDFSKWGPVERVPFRSIRRATARQMSLAWSQIPHVNSQDYVDVTRLEAFRRKHKTGDRSARRAPDAHRFRAQGRDDGPEGPSADQRQPGRGRRRDRPEEVLPHRGGGEHRRGARRPRGARRRQQEHQGARRRAQRSSCRGPMPARSAWRSSRAGRFTITNAGALGGWTFAPIINHPQVAILGLGQARLQPAVVKGEKGLAIAAAAHHARGAVHRPPGAGRGRRRELPEDLQADHGRPGRAADVACLTAAKATGAATFRSRLWRTISKLAPHELRALNSGLCSVFRLAMDRNAAIACELVKHPNTEFSISSDDRGGTRRWSWVNWRRTRELLVIGSGPGGYAAAFRAADLGLDVTLVDTAPRPGGVCLYKGCIPSKTFLFLSELIFDAARANAMGVSFDPAADRPRRACGAGRPR
ncbi:MAG: 2-oxo acid dehydrogenase subunit E2 [Desulfobacterales bacterium]|nr:2-oxo acid dehydrogenase subunit E2 [Desulfobacterales bacterium]